LAARGVVEVLPPEDRDYGFDDRWDYARLLFFGMGNDHDAILARARGIAALATVLMVLGAGLFGLWAAGPISGLLAALFTALIPDVVAHGGVAYNDLPLAAAYLLAVWALDVAVRRPSPRSASLAALAVTATFGMKLSALALGPVFVVLLGAEAWGRRDDVEWRKDLLVSLGIGAAATYVAMVLLYRGDPALTLLRFNFWRTVLHATGGHEAPAYLLGQTSAGGWWYYFPVAFLFKTPAAFQGAIGLAMASLFWRWQTIGRALDRVLAWRGRAALIGAVVFGAFLLRSDLNAGFRYALPAVGLLAVLAAIGMTDLGRSWPRFARVATPVLLVAQATSVLSVYPHFLAYSSMWAGGRDEAHHALVDSNLDWGQGLLELRDFMEAEGVQSVWLSYFGSAPPEAYGIEYVALPSFFRLPLLRTPNAEESPRFTVISATNLHGTYLDGRDPFQALRELEPYSVLGHSLFVFDLGSG
jgi:4-amino-4-deoxy-L-arabinose transferase-like glycosyltransferase